MRQGGCLIVGFNGGVAKTAYRPALLARHGKAGQEPVHVYGNDRQAGKESPPLEILLGLKRPELVIIATPPKTHYPLIERLVSALQGLGLDKTSIACEKPVITSAQEARSLAGLLLSSSQWTNRIFAIDHWTVRASAIIALLRGQDYVQRNLPNAALIQAGTEQVQGDFSSVANRRIGDILRINGYLVEPSSFTEKGEPIALNFATQKPDTRTFNHPDGVVLDTATHPLALIREILWHIADIPPLDSSVIINSGRIADRFGNSIRQGDWETAEGKAFIQCSVQGLPVDITVDKYAGEDSRKGVEIHFKDGLALVLDRVGSADQIVLYAQDGEILGKQVVQGSIYYNMLASYFLEKSNVFNVPVPLPQGGLTTLANSMTGRRIEEVKALIGIHDSERGKQFD